MWFSLQEVGLWMSSWRPQLPRKTSQSLMSRAYCMWVYVYAIYGLLHDYRHSAVSQWVNSSRANSIDSVQHYTHLHPSSCVLCYTSRTSWRLSYFCTHVHIHIMWQMTSSLDPWILLWIQLSAHVHIHNVAVDFKPWKCFPPWIVTLDSAYLWSLCVQYVCLCVCVCVCVCAAFGKGPASPEVSAETGS